MFLSQTYDYTFTTNEVSWLSGSTLLLVLLLGLALYVFMGYCLGKMFQKAGREMWAGFVPIYNSYVMAEIAGKPGWWGLVPLLGVIPVLGFIASIVGFVLLVIVSIELSKAFGKDPWFAALLVLLSPVGYAILGLGNATYTKPVK